MKIIINYESIWQNSFVNKTVNETVNKKGVISSQVISSYKASMKSIKDNKGLTESPITQNTVMGVLNRLIGERHILEKARQRPDYFFKDIEHLITFNNKIEFTNEELVYLRNLSGHPDPNSFSGIINDKHYLLDSDEAKQLWGVLDLTLDELCNFIIDDRTMVNVSKKKTPLEICDKIKKFETIKNPSQLHRDALYRCVNLFEDANYNPDITALSEKEKLNTTVLYCSALYIQVKRLKLDSLLTKAGCIKGIAKRGFTKKDFMEAFAKQKQVYGNPYIYHGKKLTKSSGILEIILDLPYNIEQQLKQLIEDCAVSTFYLGKKGLAYVYKIK